MTTRTQIVEGLKAAKYEHTPLCQALKINCEKYKHEFECSCGIEKPNASIDAAIAELERLEAQQAEPVAYPNGEMCHKWFTECEGGGRYSLTARFDYVGRKIIDWYRSQHPAPKPADEQPVGDDLQFRPDRGPWRSGDDRVRVFLESDDSHHDVRLYVDGDFATHDDKRKYAANLRDRLNATSSPPAPDVLAVLDELESVENLLREAHQLGFRTAANWAQRDDMHSDVHSGAYCNDQAGDLRDIFTKVRTLTAKLRSMLGGEV